MRFGDEHVIDDDLSLLLRWPCPGIARVVLLKEPCHSATIWDIPQDVKVARQMFPGNIISISESDAQAAH
jgi:hypothetical protein